MAKISKTLKKLRFVPIFNINVKYSVDVDLCSLSVFVLQLGYRLYG